jgi:hypothetical protein
MAVRCDLELEEDACATYAKARDHYSFTIQAIFGGA